MYPAVGFTKGQVIDYYARIGPTVLPHLRDRPLTLKRYPDGVDGEYFYEKQSPGHRPDWVQTAALWSRHNKRTIEYTLAQDLPTLVWLANLADIELHTSLSLASDVTQPKMLVFDLDPGEPAAVLECAQVALWVRDLFGQLGLETFVKTSGSKGLQAYAPLNADVTYDQTKPFAQAVAQLLEKQHPELVVSRMAKERRRGRCSWTGARTTSTRRRSTSTRCERANARRSRRRWNGRRSSRRCRPRTPTRSCSPATRCSTGCSGRATCSRPFSSASRSCRRSAAEHHCSGTASPGARGPTTRSSSPSRPALKTRLDVGATRMASREGL